MSKYMARITYENNYGVSIVRSSASFEAKDVKNARDIAVRSFVKDNKDNILRIIDVEIQVVQPVLFRNFYEDLNCYIIPGEVLPAITWDYY